MLNLTSDLARNTVQHIHFIGIGGSGLSAIARLLLERGCIVSGSDRALSPLAQELAAAGARVSTGHRAENVAGADVVVRSSAIPDDNIEVQAAQQAGIPVLKRAQFMGSLMEGRLGLAIAGTAGKTTTTAMVAWLLVQLGQDPSYIIGGTAKNLGGRNAHAGKGPAFVIEADEYDRMFLGLTPDMIVVTSLEYDHPDCFPTPQDYFQAFVDFVHRLRPGGVLLVSWDHPDTRRLAGFVQPGIRALTYGTGPDADFRAENIQPNARGGFDYDANYHTPAGENSFLAHVSLQVPGMHNVSNSLAALAVIRQALPENAETLQRAAGALAEYLGAGRRFDVLGEVDGVTVVDDYAHHPAKIQAALEAARARYPGRRIWAVWQPHTYSRTRALLPEFAHSFTDANQVIVSEVYAAREKAQDFDHFSAGQVVAAMHAALPQGNSQSGAIFIPELVDITRYLLENILPGDVVLVLSAGDADQVSAQVLAGLKTRLEERKGHNA